MTPKFRAWDSVEKKFVEHFFITDNGLICNMEKPTSDRNFPIPIEKSELILMQSTGLKDKNGKEIFEGDILKSNKYITSVFYERGAYCVKFRRTPNTTVTMNVISFIEKYKTKVIGNIYENKELLDA